MEEVEGWSPWQSLRGAQFGRSISTSAGLYRIRRPDRPALLYIGQSGRLRARLGDLQVVFRNEIPYNDPHTAAPCLWVLRVHAEADLEVSVRDAPDDVSARKALECVEVSLHRRDLGVSPYANFGRMPPGWVKSTQNNAKLKSVGGVLRGHQDATVTRSQDFPCVLDTARSTVASDWADFDWTEWTWDTPPADAVGLYRIRRPSHDSLLYVGQGRLQGRLARTMDAVLGDWASGTLPADGGHSWVELPSLHAQQLLECENDLITSHACQWPSCGPRWWPTGSPHPSRMFSWS